MKGGYTPDGSELLHDPNISMAEVTEDILGPMNRLPNIFWHMGFGLAQLCLLLGGIAVAVQMYVGLGPFGITHPTGWGFYITNFVFWIGIGHAGTLISAILFIFRQKWRTAINRSAEAMTIFAVMTAGLFPLLHVGRTWVAYWLIPYPNTRLLWVNFRSPLLWDVFAVTTYMLVSIIFWYTGLVPDLATARDRAKNKILRAIYGTLSLGWTGSARDWNHYERAYAQFAWLSAPLVLSVHSIVSFDFAVSCIPGWHTTIFPPYFVAGAIFSGFGMVVTLLVVLRKAFNFEKYITINHMELMNKIILATSLLVGYAYISEFFVAWYSENPYERAQFLHRLMGPKAWAFWTMFTCNAIIPHVFWFKWARRNIPFMFVISIFVNIGMWFERYNIFVQSLERDFLPVNWWNYRPELFDYLTTIAAFGNFFVLFLLFCRVLPTIAIAEIKAMLANPAGKGAKRDFEVLAWPAESKSPSPDEPAPAHH